MLLLRRSNVACLFFHTLILSVINQGRVWALMYGGGRSNVVVQRGLRLHRLRHHDRQHHPYGGHCEDFDFIILVFVILVCFAHLGDV